VEFVRQSLWSNLKYPLYRGTDDMFYCSISLVFKPLVLSIDCLHQWLVFFRLQNLQQQVLQIALIIKGAHTIVCTCVYGAYTHQQYSFIFFIRNISRFRSNNSILRMQLREPSC
jgi:hypothetical protein